RRDHRTLLNPDRVSGSHPPRSPRDTTCIRTFRHQNPWIRSPQPVRPPLKIRFGMKRFVTSLSRHSFGVRNRSPWGSMLYHSLHQFHENDLFTSAAAMSYFGLMALFPALLLLLAISNKLAAGSQMLAQAVDVYPGSSKFLRDTIE